MSIDSILPPTELSDSEKIKIGMILRDPLFKKYIRELGQKDCKNLLTLNSLEIPVEKLGRMHAKIEGKLEVYATLASVPELKEHEVEPVSAPKPKS